MLSESKIQASLEIFKSWQNQLKRSWTVSDDLFRNEMISDTTKLLETVVNYPLILKNASSTSGVANFRSTGLESSQFCCPIADELTFAEFSVYFVRFCLNFSYFSLVLSLFGISVSTNRCELPLLNATICHLPQTWKNILVF